MELRGIHHITLISSDIEQTTRFGRMGVGVAHHCAFLVETDDEQRAWRDRLRRAGVQTTDVIDRRYFRSIYFSDPDGGILEIATRGPGFFVDEDREHLGTPPTIHS